MTKIGTVDFLSWKTFPGKSPPKSTSALQTSIIFAELLYDLALIS